MIKNHKKICGLLIYINSFEKASNSRNAGHAVNGLDDNKILPFIPHFHKLILK